MALKTWALLFDFDGVLADTEPLIGNAWARLMASHNAPFSWDDYCRFGRGVKDEPMLRRLPQLQANPSLLAKLIDETASARQIVRDAMEEHPPIPDATIAMLHGLTGFRIALVTSSRLAEVESVLRNAGVLQCFHTLISADDTVHHKPDPEPYLLARTRLGLERGLAFEDSESGLTSAAVAGWTAILVDDPCRLSQIVAASLAAIPD
jgi:HAD superfamily hydrolase (TIGR01509 family)